jgi:lipocalin
MLNKIICHWTAGSYNVNEQDKEHYHFIIDGTGKVITGDYPPEANISTSDADGYAAHTRGCNTGAIGVSIAAMAGAVENPFDAGKYPVLQLQWGAMVKLVADLAKKYNIPVSTRTILTHAEVEGTLGIQQAGKWDITRLPFEPATIGAKAIGDKLRKEVQAMLGVMINVAVTPPAPRFVTHEELAKAFRDLADKLGK